MSLMSQSSGGGGNMTNTIKNVLLLSSDKTKILLEFNHNLDYATSYGGSSSSIEMADFAVTVGGSSVTPVSGNFSGTNASADKWLSLTLPSAISAGDTVVVNYDPSGGSASTNLMTAAIPSQYQGVQLRALVVILDRIGYRLALFRMEMDLLVTLQFPTGQ